MQPYLRRRKVLDSQGITVLEEGGVICRFIA